MCIAIPWQNPNSAVSILNGMYPQARQSILFSQKRTRKVRIPETLVSGTAGIALYIAGCTCDFFADLWFLQCCVVCFHILFFLVLFLFWQEVPINPPLEMCCHPN